MLQRDLSRMPADAVAGEIANGVWSCSVARGRAGSIAAGSVALWLENTELVSPSGFEPETY